MKKNSSRWVQWSERMYERLLHAYPAEFREKFAGEMIFVFRELAAEAFRHRGILGLALAWLRVLGDLLWTASKEHFVNLQRRIVMKTALRTFLWSLLAAFIHYFVFVSLGVLLFGSIFLIQGGSWLASSRHPTPAWIEFLIFIPPPFLAGMILARVQPFFRPYLTAPLGIMMIGLIATLVDASYAWNWGGWQILGGIVFTVLLSLVTLLGCVTATKLSRSFGKAETARQVTTTLI
jgi:hypothetical protein